RSSASRSATVSSKRSRPNSYVDATFDVGVPGERRVPNQGARIYRVRRRDRPGDAWNRRRYRNPAPRRLPMHQVTGALHDITASVRVPRSSRRGRVHGSRGGSSRDGGGTSMTWSNGWWKRVPTVIDYGRASLAAIVARVAGGRTLR